MSDPRQPDPVPVREPPPGTPGNPRDPIPMPEDEDKGDPEGEDA